MAKVEKTSQSRRGGSRPGERRGGRQKGTPNKVTVSLKQAVLDTFENLGDVKHMTTWARQHPSDFYRIAARLIPSGSCVQIEGVSNDLATQGGAVIQAMASGNITPDQASTMMQALSTQARLIETHDLERRIETLEGKYNTHIENLKR